jgi:hypothetical protein
VALRDTLETLARRLRRAVVLYDVDLVMVDFTADDRTSDEARRLNVLARHASPTAAAMIRDSGANQAHAPVRIPPLTGARGRVIHPVHHRDRLVGYLSYIDDGPQDAPIPAEDAAALSAAAPALAEALATRRLDEDRDHARTSALLRSLLLAADPAAAQALRESAAVPASPAYTIAVVSPAPGAAADPRVHLANALTRALTYSPSRLPWTLIDPPRPGAVPHAALVLACPGIDADARALPVAGALGAEAGVGTGIGGVREGLADLHTSYREALVALDAARRATATPVAAWAALGVERLLARLPLDTMSAADLPPAVRTLLATDRAGTLAATLEAYLDHAGDAQATARALTIHRSTLYYRLARVRDLTAADLSDGRVRLELHAGLRTAALLGLR